MNQRYDAAIRLGREALRVTILVTALHGVVAVLGPERLRGQEEDLVRGDRVRLLTAGTPWRTGRIEAVGAESVVLRSVSGARHSFRIPQVDSLEKSVFVQTRGRIGAIVGAVTGVVVGVRFGWVLCGDQGRPPSCVAELAAPAAGFFAFLGWAFGSMSRQEEWLGVPTEALRTMREPMR